MFQRYQKAIAVLLAGVVSIAALFIPWLRDLPPEAFAAVSSSLALAGVYFAPNKIAGHNVDAVAGAVLAAHERAAGDRAVYSTRPDMSGPTRLVRLRQDSRGRGEIEVTDLPPRVPEEVEQ